MRRPLAPGEPLPPGAERRQPAPPPFHAVTASDDGQQVIVAVLSPIMADNSAGAAQHLKQLSGTAAPDVVADMSNCPFIDTSGLSVIVEWRKDLVAAGRQFRLRSPSRSVRRILNLTRMDRFITVEIGESKPLSDRPE